jgi:adenosylhomocysteinase
VLPDLAFARSAVRRFSRATNFLLTGRTFAVLGDDPRGRAVRQVLLACGGCETGEAPDHLFVVGDVTWPEIAAHHPAIVADAHGSLVDALIGPAHGVPVHDVLPASRDGILLVDGIPIVAIAPELPPQPALPEAAGRMSWAADHMPLTASFARDLLDHGALTGRRIAVSMVLEPKTAVLALALRHAGAEVAVFSHRYETDDAVAAHLRSLGVPVFAEANGDAEHDRELALRLLDTDPDLLLDDGAHVIRLAHAERPGLLDRMVGAAEETTSGVRALIEMGSDLRLPVIAVNDAITKTRFDNRYGTGQSCVFALADTLEAVTDRLRVSSFQGARVAVFGFGPVGQGVAQFAAVLGATVTVVDVDPRAELEARYAGYATGCADDVVASSGIVISATGVARTVTLDLLGRAPRGAVFAVAGGVDDEIETSRLRAQAPGRRVGDHVEEFDLDVGREIVLIDGGGCVNITSGEGNPIQIMDLSFAAQLQAVRTLLAAQDRRAGLAALPEEADREIARRALGGEASPRGTNGTRR